MSEIICTCGHGIGLHDNDICGGFERLLEPLCKCRLSSEAVEARYWVHKMMVERNEAQKVAKMSTDNVMLFWRQHDALKQSLKVTIVERDALQSKLDAYMQLVKTTVHVDEELCDTREMALVAMREVLLRLWVPRDNEAIQIIRTALARLDNTMKDTNHDLNNQGISQGTGGRE